MKLSVNSSLADNKVLMYKEKSEDSFEFEPAFVDIQDSVWVLARIYHDSTQETDVIKGLRISMELVTESETKAQVLCKIFGDNIEAKTYSFTLQSDCGFSIAYINNSAYYYSSKYGLVGDKGLALSDAILSPEGVLIGTNAADGLFLGGKDAKLTASIRLQITRPNRLATEYANPQIASIVELVERMKQKKHVTYNHLVEALNYSENRKSNPAMADYRELFDELTNLVLANYPGLICVSNIDYLFTNKKGVGLVRVEEEAGLRQGYFSRLKKKWERNEATPDPDLKFLMICSREFQISMNDLLHNPLAGLNEDDRKAQKVVDKLYADTVDRKLYWDLIVSTDTKCEYKTLLPNGASILLKAVLTGSVLDVIRIDMSSDNNISLSNITDERKGNSPTFQSGKRLYDEIKKQFGFNGLSDNDKKLLDEYLSL